MEKQSDNAAIRVFYDAACPGCERDRAWYEKHVDEGEQIQWLDINTHEQELDARGIDPKRAMLELHVEDEHGKVWQELPAYQILFSRLPGYRWLAWLIGLPVINPYYRTCIGCGCAVV